MKTMSFWMLLDLVSKFNQEIGGYIRHSHEDEFVYVPKCEPRIRFTGSELQLWLAKNPTASLSDFFHSKKAN